MADKVWIRFPYFANDMPQFLCTVHSSIMHKDKKTQEYKCKEKGCAQNLEFHEIQKIAQWLRSYV